jgi:hypothetical protein
MVEEHTIHFLVVVRASDSGTLDFVAMGTTATAIQSSPPIVN